MKIKISPQRQSVRCWGFSPLQLRPTPCGYRDTEEDKSEKRKLFLGRFELEFCFSLCLGVSVVDCFS